MAQFEYWMTTDLKRGSSQVQVLHGQTFTQDNMGNRVGVVVLDGGEPATLNGTVTGYVIRADGGTVLVTGAVDGNRAYIDLPESAYAVPGQIQIAIRLVSSEAKTVLGAVSAYVQRTATGTIIDPGHVIPDIDDLLAQIERMEQGTAAAEEAAENAVAAVAAPFDETADYVYGDYATHNGALYMATEDITAGSPFTPGQWQKITVMDTVGTAVLYTPQSLSNAQRLQAAENIDVLTKGWGQTLTADQKQAVRDKIGLPFIDWDTNWTDAQKAQARKNLNAADIGNAKTPEMYGAKGDGITDDGNALLSAFSEASAAGVPLVCTYGKTYAIGRFLQMTGHRINVYGNGATIKVLAGTSTLNEVLYISDDDDGQFPDTKGKGLIENLTIDCNGLAKCGIHIGMAKGYELQNLDICGFTEKGLIITSGFEIFCHNIRIAGSGVAGSVGLRMNTSDSRFVNIVTKNVAVGIENHGAANYYTHVHAWNTLAAIAPTSIMFDSYADLHASDCYVDTCAIGIYQHSDDPVEVNGLTIVNSGSLMSNTPTVFKLTNPSYAARVHGTGMVYLSDADYNMFEADVSQYAKDYDWLGNNDSSTHGMGNMPNAYAITEEIADLKSALTENNVTVESLNPTVLANCSIYSNGAIISSSGFNVYVFNISGINRIKIDSGSIYAFYASMPSVNVTPSIDSMRHIRTLNNTELRVPTGANYVAVRHTTEPTVTDIDTLKRTVDDLEYIKAFNTKSIQFSVTGKYINQSGTETANAEYACTDYIDTVGGADFTVHAFYSSYASFAAYDADRNIVEVWQNTGTLGDKITYKLQSNVRYVRWSVNANYIDDINAVTAYITNNIDDLIKPKERCGYDGYEINVFKHGICIGDSLTAGTFNYDDNGVNKSDYADANYSFPKMLSKLTGIEIYTSAIGGNTSYEWYQDHISATIAGFDFAIIQFGVNDALEYNGWTENSVNGFTGIINMLKRDNNGIKIFVATTIPALAYGGQAFNDVNNGIRELVASMNDENVILLDMAKYGSTKLKQYNAGHLTAIGYSRLAVDYKNFISWYIATNADQFRSVQFIGTNKVIPSEYD